MFNKIIMVGNLTRDIELRYTEGGTAVASAAIATNRKFKNQNGEQKEEVCFTDITFFGRTAEIANQYLSRGKQILVEGHLKLDQWTDQNGGKRSKHSITVESLQMLGGRDNDNNNSGQYNNQQNAPQQNAPQQRPSQQGTGQQPSFPEVDTSEEKIPF